ncbi:MAG: hypothetical protein ISS70_24710 [Phycisphaerae bacterium]|nr:hypothetical protein [Phycisphaerae bacterium]
METHASGVVDFLLQYFCVGRIAAAQMFQENSGLRLPPVESLQEKAEDLIDAAQEIAELIATYYV